MRRKVNRPKSSESKEGRKPFRGTDDRPRSRAERVPGSSPNLIYGVLPVLEALRAETRRIDKVLIAEGSKEHRLSQIVDLCRERSIAWNYIPRESFAKHLDPGVNHQGVAAFISSAAYFDADAVLDQTIDPALVLVLDGVEDPRNLGAILRVAECSGVDGVILQERRAVGLNDTVAKSSAGAIEYVRVSKVGNLNRFIEAMKERNIWVVGTSGDAQIDYTEWDWTRPSALVLGAEGSGLHRLVAENCDVLVRIPMHGKIDSLNVSVAAGVILFEAKRQRSRPK
jgi:23S rRNA (guanosine2251-2'-O)-methyltransferase